MWIYILIHGEKNNKKIVRNCLFWWGDYDEGEKSQTWATKLLITVLKTIASPKRESSRPLCLWVWFSSVCLSVRLSVCMYVCQLDSLLTVCLSVSRLKCLSTVCLTFCRMSVCLSAFFSIYLSVFLFVCRSSCLVICLPSCRSVCLYVNVSVLLSARQSVSV